MDQEEGSGGQFPSGFCLPPPTSDSSIFSSRQPHGALDPFHWGRSFIPAGSLLTGPGARSGPPKGPEIGASSRHDVFATSEDWGGGGRPRILGLPAASSAGSGARPTSWGRTTAASAGRGMGGAPAGAGDVQRSAVFAHLQARREPKGSWGEGVPSLGALPGRAPGLDLWRADVPIRSFSAISAPGDLSCVRGERLPP